MYTQKIKITKSDKQETKTREHSINRRNGEKCEEEMKKLKKEIKLMERSTKQ